jgi:peptide/nickel transport system substrate-binding protein
MRRVGRSRGLRAFAIAAALITFASACGGGDDNGNEGGSSGTPTTKGLTGGGDEGTPVPGGSLTYALEADTSGGWCLYKAQLAISGIQVARAIYDTLTAPGEDGKIHPFLAESVTSKDNKTWTIKLREGIKFHDGSALTASVVKENLDHYRKDNQLFVFVFADVNSIDVVDDLTLTVSLKRPWTAFPWHLWSSSRLGIMAKAQMDSPNCDDKLIGTGPFTKQSWKFGDKFVAKKNPNYWGKDADGKQLPYLEQITFVGVENSERRVQSLQSGDYTMIHTSEPNSIVKLREDSQAGKLKGVESDKFTEVGYVMLNSTKEPFNHLSARQAVAYGVDRDTYNRLRNAGILTNASGPFAPGNDGYVEDTGMPTFDPAKSKAAAAKYKQETGKDLTFTLSHTADPNTTADAVLVQQMLKQNSGINIGLNPVPDQSTLINIAIGKQFDATLWRNHPGSDPDLQYVWWHCGNSAGATLEPNSPACDNLVNFAGFNDPVISKAFDDARVSKDDAERTALYEKINKRFAEQLWNLWAQWSLWTVYSQNTVNGVLGPELPDGAKPFPGLATGHPVSAMWCTGGKC